MTEEKLIARREKDRERSAPRYAQLNLTESNVSALRQAGVTVTRTSVQGLYTIELRTLKQAKAPHFWSHKFNTMPAGVTP